MITGEIKQKVDAVWQTFWNNGFTQPSAIFEQMTYLLFMKMLDERQQSKELIASLTGDTLVNPTFPDGLWHNPTTDQEVPYREMRWHVFKEMAPDKMLNRVRNDVFIFLRHIGGIGSAYSRAMEDTVFQINNARLLSRVVEGIEEIASDGADMMGDVYEYMLSKMAASGTNGQFRTPRHIIRLMVELMRPTLDDTICDPAMGSAGFLMEARPLYRGAPARPVAQHRPATALPPRDIPRLRLRRLHAAHRLHEHDAARRRRAATLLPQLALRRKQRYQPLHPLPGQSPLCRQSRPGRHSPLAAGCRQDQKDRAALPGPDDAHAAKPAAGCASIVPDTVLTGDAQALQDHTLGAGRQPLPASRHRHAQRGVPAIQRGYRRPSSSSPKTGTGGTDRVWFYDMRADGFFAHHPAHPPHPNRTTYPILWSATTTSTREAGRSRKEQSFLVPADEIRENGYDLSYKRYHEVERQAIVYDAPETIIARMEERQKAIDQAFAEFKKLLNS